MRSLWNLLVGQEQRNVAGRRPCLSLHLHWHCSFSPVIRTDSKGRIFPPTGQNLTAETGPLIARDDQIVFYGTYLEGVPFYLRIERPIWLVEARRKAEPKGNYYLAGRRPVSAPGYGKIAFTDEEFAEHWKRNERTFRVFLKEMSLARSSSEIGGPPRVLAKLNEYLLVTNR